MRKNLLLLLFCSIMASSIAATWTGIQSSTPGPASVDLISSTQQASILKFTLDGYSIEKVSTPMGDAYILEVEEAFRMLQEGQPDLLKLSASLIIPDNEDMELVILSKKYIDYPNIDIAPSKGNLTRDVQPSIIPYTYGKAYSTDAFFPGKLAELQDPYIFRDYRGVAVWAFPFQYNAVTRTLRVVYEIEVEVRTTGSKKNNVSAWVKPSKVNREFDNIYSSHFLNYSSPKYTAIDEQGSMLIISHGLYMSEMQEFVNWKNMSGIPTEIVNVSTIGNAAAIKTYIANYYAANDLAFVLLVGDAAQVPTQTLTSGHSDNSYGYISGNDSYPEIFVGRFSGESNADIFTQTLRTINYEQNPYMGSNWYNRSMGIASSQGPGDDNEMDYQHIRNMQTDLLAYTYTNNEEYFDGSQGGNDASGNPSAALVGTGVNSGAGVILYTGHGSTTSWGTSGFSNSGVNALTNTGMLPFIWSVACVNGNFVSNTCFAEAWMRARSGDIPKGAIATLMSTINQSWDPPMEAQDEMVDILVESYSANIKRTFAGLSINGCMKMNDTYGSGGAEMTDTWNLFGDPSLMVRTDTPKVLTVFHSPTIMLGTGVFQAGCLTDGARVTLSSNYQILASETIVNGIANFSFSPLTTLDSISIVVTSYNAIPYMGTVQVIPASGPYVMHNNTAVMDPGGNNNGLPDFGETVSLDVSLTNMGIDTASQVSAVLSTNDPYVTLTVSSGVWGNILAGDTNTLNGAFTVNLANNIPDQHDVNFDINIQDTAGNAWSSYFSIKAYAPNLVTNSFSIDDATSGNGNGVLDPGETVDIIFNSANTGHCDALSTIGRLLSSNPLVTILNDTFMFNTMAIGISSQAVFTISLDQSIALGSNVDLVYVLESGAYSSQDVFYLMVGDIVEDFETGDFSKYSWTFGGNANWTVSNQNPYMGSYSSKSGAIPHDASTELSITLNVLTNDSISFYRKVSSEQNYDFFQFYIDNDKKDEWSGTKAWAKEGYAVSAGTHTFTWKYEKDFYVASGSDCAWLDDIKLPPAVIPGSTLSLGALAVSGSICEGETTQLLAVPSGGSGSYTYNWAPASSLSNVSISNPIATPLTTTTYSVVVHDGVDSTFASVIVTVNPIPQTPVISLSGLELLSSSASSYQWYGVNGAISGATGQAFTPTSNGNYYVIVANADGCKSSASNTFNYTLTYIDDPDTENSIFIYPNPFSSELNLSFFSEQGGAIEVVLFNALGQQMMAREIEAFAGSNVLPSINTSGLNDGIYYLRLKSGENIITRKVIKNSKR